MFFLDRACRDAGVKLRQCWFPGYHGNIGGESDPRDDVNSVDEMTFAWMIDQLTYYNLLQINKRALRYPILDRLSADLKPNGHRPDPPRSPQEVHERRIDWSDGALYETQTLFWHVASEAATQRWEYVRKPGQYHAKDLQTREELDYTNFCETIHPCVWHRVQHRNYEPRSLPRSQWDRVKASDGPGFEWVKHSRSGLMQTRIPEYIIPDIPRRDNRMEHWSGSLEMRIVPGDYLLKLDRGNGIDRGRQRPKMTARIDSAYVRDGYDENYLTPTVSRNQSGYAGAGEREYIERETLTIRESSPRPVSRGAAAEYYDIGADLG